MATQILSTLATALCLFVGWKVYRRYQRNRKAIADEREREHIAKKEKQLELDKQQAIVDWHRVTTQALQAAILRDHHYTVRPDGTLIVAHPARPPVQVTEVAQQQQQIAEPVLPGVCTLSDVLQEFTPSVNQIFLSYLPGAKMIAPPVTDLCHVANAGATGEGKSVSIRLIIAQLCYVGARVVLLNPHYTSYDRRSREDWTPIENRLYKSPVRAFGDIKQWLQWAAEVELRKRLDLYARSRPWGGPLFIVVEELPAITRHIPEAMGWLSDILREGRKVELFLITAAQDMLVKTLGSSGGAIRDCFRTAIYVGGDATTARVLLDVKGTVDDGSLGKGVVMLRSSQNKQASLARVPYVDNESLYTLLGPSTFQHSNIVDSTADQAEDFPSGASSNLSNGRGPEDSGEVPGRTFDTGDDLSVKQALRDIGKRLKNGEDRAKILQSYGATSGRANQEIGAVIDAMIEQIESETN